MASAAPRSRVRRFVVGAIKTFVYLALLGGLALGVAVAVAVNQLPSFAELQRRANLGQMIRVRADDGTVIQTMGPVFGEWLRYDQIPPVMRDAMVATEDRRFRYHPGVDPIGIVRALEVRATRGHWAQGGSTITQQLARNIFLNNDFSFGRKVREAILAMALEWRFSKDQILELYLNRVYFGGGAYGIDAASRRFFGHSATDLSIPEAAIVAGLVKAPSNYSPTADAEAARSRAGVVMDLMVQNGAITAAQAAAANPADVQLARPTSRQDSARYFIDWVLPQLDTMIDETSQPIDVWTTINLNMQRAADRAINADTPAGAQGALVSLDRDGAVRAMVGGRNYVTSIYNRATQATRQSGSAFKLFVYLAALESGFRPDTMLEDAPVTIDGWSPRNDNGRYVGPVSMQVAFAYSINTVAARLAQQVGTRTVADMAQRLGITTRISTYPSMALGTADVRLIDMTRAYATVGSGGVAVVPYGVRRVTTADGTLLYTHQADANRVLLPPWVAAAMTQLLAAVVEHGTGTAAQLGRPTAGKTGTTTSNRDGWFVGFSSGITTGVWMGRDDSRVVGGLYGGRAPARAFHDFMVTAVANRAPEPFATEAAAPDWQVNPDQEMWLAPPADNATLPQVDEDGYPIAPQDDDDQGLGAGPGPGAGDDGPPPLRDNGKPQADQRLDDAWLDRTLRTRPRRPPDAAGDF
ncbi:transglycosylase domain-containing protein [Sphingosinicella ginsenosidimutans]|uniref:PBP1A family penicillin-binding protein n=1 Tax=Allosphingosinicella ginsenosidimutans TaxID=1176539 RepID=A0A5C6TSH2_9SPHN|nr:PBP1A family penicillin-binding protein [Sphingosinicella ginsenosidimutans]TXC63297.1 PBP1A family penicillin-binding protein [Sphingosinicella ginsenosidimutans]